MAVLLTAATPTRTSEYVVPGSPNPSRYPHRSRRGPVGHGTFWRPRSGCGPAACPPAHRARRRPVDPAPTRSALDLIG
ncbi:MULTISPECIES: hypothetical protein [unclassified Micromonospora]|uniref:hypothetical protein n=1 Tax=unclassified Micromonospora TaxID=2617518 RepID=UPI003A893E66